MDLSQLRALRMVIELGSFTRAAGELFVTQPAVSHQIRSLEQELDQKLLQRDGRTITPTHAGQVLYDYARRILTLAEEAEAVLSDLRAGERGQVTIAAIGTTTVYVLPDILHEFRLQHPGVQVILRTAGGEEVKEMVGHGVADLGIVGSHTDTAGFATRSLCPDDIVPVVAAGHRCARQKRVTLAKLAEEPLILLGGWKSWENYVRSMFAQAGVGPKVHLQLDSIEAVKRMVERGLGFAIIPALAAEAEMRAGTLVPLTLTDVPQMQRSIVLIHQQDRHLTAAMQQFVALLVARMGARG